MNEPETVLQPSLHTLSDYALLVFDEARSRGIDMDDLVREHDEDADGEFCGERIMEALERISDAGYSYVEQDDTLLIWPKGMDVPAEWSD